MNEYREKDNIKIYFFIFKLLPDKEVGLMFNKINSFGSDISGNGNGGNEAATLPLYIVYWWLTLENFQFTSLVVFAHSIRCGRPVSVCVSFFRLKYVHLWCCYYVSVAMKWHACLPYKLYISERIVKRKN